jgi:hypothetical protein
MVRAMRSFLLSLFSFAMLATAAQAAPVASGAWLRLVPGQENGAGYLKLSNSARKADALTAIKSDCCKAVELHEMSMDGEAMHMRKVDRVMLPPQHVTEFNPMGFHLMFIGFKKAPDNGAGVPVTLIYENGATQEVDFKVKLVGADDAGGHAGNR